MQGVDEMDKKKKFCVVCGKRIPELSLRRTLCSDYCRNRKKCGYAPYLNYDLPPFSELTEMQLEAQKKGMSYGKYVASLSNTKREDKNNG
jgi:hypothetical protein